MGKGIGNDKGKDKDRGWGTAKGIKNDRGKGRAIQGDRRGTKTRIGAMTMLLKKYFLGLSA